MDDMRKTKKQLIDELNQLRSDVVRLNHPTHAMKVDPDPFSNIANTFDNLIEGCQIIGFDWKYLYVNKTVIDHARKTRNELLGRTMMEVYPGIENTDMFQQLKGCMQDRQPRRFDNEFFYKDGTSRWFDLSVQPVQEGIFVLSMDITERKLAEEAVKSSETRFRDFFEHATVGMYRTSPQGEILMTNPVLVEMLKFDSFKEMAQRNLNVEGFGEERPRTSFVDEVEKMGAVKEIESVWLTRDNERVYVRESARKVCDEHGETRYYEGMVENITEYKKNMLLLERQKELLQSIFDNIPVMLIIWDDRLKRFTLNRFSEIVLGWTGDEANDGDFMARVYPDADYRRRVSDYMQSLKSGWKEWEVTSKSGHRIPSNWANIRLSDNTMVGIGVDLRQQKQTEKKLKEQSEQLRLFIDYAPAALAMFDRNMHYISASRHWITDFGLEDQEILGRSHYELFPEIPESLKAIHRRGMQGEVISGDNDAFVRPDGSMQWLRWEMRPWFEGDEIGGIVIFSEDVTDHHLAEQEKTTTVEFLHLVNQSASSDELIKKSTAFFYERSGCDAVGIRIRKDNDYPYYETRGFPEEFVLLENSLCVRDANNDPVLDTEGYPILECMCGNVINGRFDASQPFFSEKGSFWTNCTTKLLASSSEKDRQGRTRNRCNGEGYESVALLPLHVGDDRLGLLQLNHKKPNHFMPQIIALWERLADYLAVALAKFLADEGLKRHTCQLEVLRRIDSGILEARTFREISEEILERLAEMLPGCTRMSVAVFDEVKEMARLLAVKTAKNTGIGPGQLIPVARFGLLDKFKKGAFHKVQEIRPMNLMTDIDRRLYDEGLRSYAQFPLIVENNLIGSLNVAADEPGCLRNEFLEFIKQVAGQLAIALEQSRMREEIARYTRDLEELVNERTAALEMTQRRYKTISEMTSDYIFSFFVAPDESLQLEWISEGFTRAMGYDLDEIRTPEQWMGKIHQDDLDDFVAALKSVLTGKQAETNMRTWTREGALHWYEIRAVLQTTDSPETPRRILGAAEDITERKAAEEAIRTLNADLEIRHAELESANKELEAFAYSVSHDLRAPLRAIDGFTRILMEDYVSRLDDEAKRLGRVIQSNSHKMGQLIDDLLTFSRMGRKALNFTRVDMKNMVRAIYHEVSDSAQRNQVDFCVGELPHVEADTNMMRQVWMNLISNALKFSSKQESIRIAIDAIQQDSSVVFSVRDNGCGFDMQYVDKLFGVFQRLHSQKEYPGTGVGLALVQRIIIRHGGKVWAESDLGRGTKISFSLPEKQTPSGQKELQDQFERGEK